MLEGLVPGSDPFRLSPKGSRLRRLWLWWEETCFTAVCESPAAGACVLPGMQCLRLVGYSLLRSHLWLWSDDDDMPLCSGKTRFSAHRHHDVSVSLLALADDAGFPIEPVVWHTVVCFYRALSRHLPNERNSILLTVGQVSEAAVNFYSFVVIS